MNYRSLSKTLLLVSLLWSCPYGVADAIFVEGIDQPLRGAILEAHALATTASQSSEPINASQAWGELAMLLQAHNLNQQAIASYSTAIEHAVDPRWFYLRGIARNELGYTEEAIPDFEVAVGGVPNIATIWLRLGQAQLRVGEVQAAEKSVSRALDIESNLALGHMLLAEILTLKQKPIEAGKHLEQAFALDPEAGQIAYRLAQLARSLGKVEASENWLTKHSNQHAPQIDDPMLEMVAAYSLNPALFVSAARRAFERGDFETAVQSYRQALAMDPNDFNRQLDFLRLLSAAERWHELDDHLVQLEPSMSESSDYWYLRALHLLQKRDLSKAKESIERSIGIEPTEDSLKLQDQIEALNQQSQQ